MGPDAQAGGVRGVRRTGLRNQRNAGHRTPTQTQGRARYVDAAYVYCIFGFIMNLQMGPDAQAGKVRGVRRTGLRNQRSEAHRTPTQMQGIARYDDTAYVYCTSGFKMSLQMGQYAQAGGGQRS